MLTAAIGNIAAYRGGAVFWSLLGRSGHRPESKPTGSVENDPLPTSSVPAKCSQSFTLGESIMVAYVIADTDIHDHKTYDEYKRQVLPIIANVPPNTPHAGGKPGTAKTRILITYVVEKGKPLASPA
jgi:hypothetical protein